MIRFASSRTSDRSLPELGLVIMPAKPTLGPLAQFHFFRRDPLLSHTLRSLTVAALSGAATVRANPYPQVECGLNVDFCLKEFGPEQIVSPEQLNRGLRDYLRS